jgi:hypothetical protein
MEKWKSQNREGAVWWVMRKISFLTLITLKWSLIQLVFFNKSDCIVNQVSKKTKGPGIVTFVKHSSGLSYTTDAKSLQNSFCNCCKKCESVGLCNFLCNHFKINGFTFCWFWNQQWNLVKISKSNKVW